MFGKCIGVHFNGQLSHSRDLFNFCLSYPDHQTKIKKKIW